MAKSKFLIETSAVPVALGESTPAHRDSFKAATEGGSQSTSVYIRKEFIHRWVLYYIRVAFEIDHQQTVSAALFHLHQSFRIREVKTLSHTIAALLEEHETISNCRSMAKEVARLAFGRLRKFDAVFRSRTANSCGCQIGGKEMRVDFNTVFDDLTAFVDGQGVVRDCEVNDFLGLGKAEHGRAAKLLANPECRETKSGKKASEYLSARSHITCRECARIGDIVIALEQPKFLTLVHIDADFTVLCRATGRPSKQIPSEAATHK